MSRDVPFSRRTSATDEVAHFSECSIRNRIVRYIQDTQGTAGLRCDRMIMEYMQHVQDFTLCHSGRRHSDADVFRRLQRRLRQT